MKAVYSKELRQGLLSYMGMGFIFTFLFFAGIMVTYWNFYSLSSSFEVIFAYLPFAVIALLPLLTIGAFSAERRRGTDRFLSMLPLSSKDIALGKYFSRLTVLMIPNVILAFVPVVLDFGGEVGYASAYTVLLVFSLLEALLLAVCLFVDARCKGKVTSIVLPYAVLVLLFLVGYASRLIPADNTALRILSRVLYNLSPFAQLDGFLYGIVDFRVIFVYIAITVLFVALTVLSFDKAHGSYGHEDYKKTVQCRSARTVSLVLLCAILFANVGVLTAPDRYSKIDITSERTYTLSDETKSFLSSLDKPVTLYAVNFEDSEQRIRLFLDRMASYNKCLTVVDVDTAKDTEIVEKYGLAELDESSLKNSIIVESDARAQMIYYSQLFTYTNEEIGFSRISASEWQYYYSMYSSSTEYAQYAELMITDTDMYFEGQSLISEYIEYVHADYIPSPYVLGGHETDISSSLFNYVCAYYYGLDIKTLTLADGDSVPPEVSSLVIARPVTDITDGELSAIRAYLAGGGQVTVLTEESNLAMPNLTALLADYGMSAGTGILNDTVVVEEETEETEAKTEETATLSVTPNYDHDIMASLAGESAYAVTVTNANAISIDPDKEASLLLTPLLTTGETAYIAGAPEQKGSYTVAAAAEKASGDRLVWFTGADALLGLGDLSNAGEQQLNDALSVLLAVSWTNNVYKSELAEAPASQYTAAALEISETASTVLGMLFVVIIPLCVIAPFMVIRYKREKAL